jgi:hypothetical protein
MLKTIFALLLLQVSVPLFSQKYTTAAGLRLGGGIGITVQQALWNHNTAELQWQKGFTNNLTTVTALFEQHHSIFSKGTNFYLGIGPHMGSYDIVGKVNERANVFGLSGIGGMEFKFGRTILSADIKPAINLSGGNRVLETQTGISLRYVFIKAPKKEHKWMFWKRRKNSKKDKED